MPDTFEKDWKELRDLIERSLIPSVKSAAWESLIGDFQAPKSQGELEWGLFKVNSNRNYYFLKIDEETFATRVERAALWFTFLGSVLFKRLSSWLWNLNLSKIASGNLMAYPRYNIALKQLGLWKDYTVFCKELDISTASFNTAKLFYVSSLLRDTLACSGQALNILEIGGGPGNLAVMLARRFVVSKYVIIDLPEMILHSSLTIRHFFPDVPISFSHCHTDSVLPILERGFHFVYPHDIGRIRDNAFDVCLNVDSFQEMTADQITRYLSFVQRSVKDGGLSINLNRRRIVGESDNNPFLYSYYRSNEIVRWETDPFMFRTLSVSGLKDPHVLRLERIRKRAVGRRAHGLLPENESIAR